MTDKKDGENGDNDSIRDGKTEGGIKGVNAVGEEGGKQNLGWMHGQTTKSRKRPSNTRSRERTRSVIACQRPYKRREHLKSVRGI